MPKIDEGMFRLEIRLDDHDPAHCHAVCPDGEVKIKLTDDDAMLYPMLSQSPVLGNLNRAKKGTKSGQKASQIAAPIME